jgi:hypothetical protein
MVQDALGMTRPLLQPGMALLITADENSSREVVQASLWSLVTRSSQERRSPGYRAPAMERDFLKDSNEAWDEACRAVNFCLPVLWTRLRDLSEREISARHLTLTQVTEKNPIPAPSLLGGRSFGISFFLSIVSTLLALRLPDDVAATGEVDGKGRISRVDHVGPKTRGIIDAAPSIRRFLVPEENVLDARAVVKDLGADLQILGVASVDEVLIHVFGRGFGDRLVAGIQGDDRTALVESLMRITLRGRKELAEWAPVKQCARKALESWKGLSGDATNDLAFVVAVAERHDSNRGSIPCNPGWLRKKNTEIQQRILANIVQHAADVGNPDRKTVERLLSRNVPRTRQKWMASHVPVLGAAARLFAVTGRPEEALKTQTDLAEFLIGALREEEVPHQLSECYRLAGVLGKVDDYNHAESVFQRMGVHLHGIGGLFVRLARQKSRISLGLEPEIPELLELAGVKTEGGRLWLASVAGVPPEIPWSAVHWLLKAYETDPAARDLVKSELEKAAAYGDDTAKLFLALHNLETTAEESERAECMVELRRQEPALMAHLEKAAEELGQDPYQYVSRFYPY